MPLSGHSLGESYLSEEMQSVYSTVPGNSAMIAMERKKKQSNIVAILILICFSPHSLLGQN